MRQLLDRILARPIRRHYPRSEAIEQLCARKKLPMSQAVYQVRVMLRTVGQHNIAITVRCASAGC